MLTFSHTRHPFHSNIYHFSSVSSCSYVLEIRLHNLRYVGTKVYVFGFVVQFYDHLFDWGLKKEIGKLAAIRTKNGINTTSRVNILASQSDLYVAAIDDKIITKIGPKMDLRNLIPRNFKVATSGKDYAVWQKKWNQSYKLLINKPLAEPESNKNIWKIMLILYLYNIILGSVMLELL